MYHIQTNKKMGSRNQITNAFSKFLNNNAKWKSILILLGLILFINILIFPLFVTKNESKLVLDTQFSYTPEKAYKILSDYTDDELKTYIIVELTVDFVYPIVYTLFIAFLIFKLSNKSTLSLFPLLILFSDYFENIGIVTIAYYYPQKLPNIVTVTSLLTSLKWILVAISILLIVALLLMKLHNRKKVN